PRRSLGQDTARSWRRRRGVVKRRRPVQSAQPPGGTEQRRDRPQPPAGRPGGGASSWPMARSAEQPPPPRLYRGGLPLPPILLVLCLLILFITSQYPHVLWGPFVGDDYLFLEKTRRASFPSLWEFKELAFNYYRPWSRELHYWLLQHAFGMRELPFHLVNVGL